MVVPILVALIFLILFSTFQSLRQAGLILLNIPFAMIGGIVSLFASGLYLSVPASIGFITLFGVAVLTLETAVDRCKAQASAYRSRYFWPLHASPRR